MLCSNAGTAAGLQDPLGQAVAELPGEVRELKSAGRWRTADGEGFYRVVVLRGGYEHLADRLYIQWVREGDESRPARVVASVGVTEINDNGPFTFSYALVVEARDAAQDHRERPSRLRQRPAAVRAGGNHTAQLYKSHRTVSTETEVSRTHFSAATNGSSAVSAGPSRPTRTCARVRPEATLLGRHRGVRDTLPSPGGGAARADARFLNTSRRCVRTHISRA